MKDPKNIIIRMPNWLGDLVMATPVLQDVRVKWPNAFITAMCQSNVAPLLKYDPHIDEIYSFKKVSGWIHSLRRSEIVDDLKRGEYDLGILLTNSFSSAWWFWRGGVQNRTGFSANLRSCLLNRPVPYPENMETQHLVKTYKSLLLPFGIEVSSTPPQLYISDEEKEDSEKFLQSRGVDINTSKIIGINPGAAFGLAKCWLPERFREVTSRLLKDPSTIILFFGDGSGVPLVDKIINGLGDRVINLAGKTSLRELMALIQRCSVFLTNDSGPMHIASALGTPLVALFGSTSDVKTGPYGGGTVIHKHVECSPCYKKICPIDFRCMKRIEVDEVVSAILKKLV